MKGKAVGLLCAWMVSVWVVNAQQAEESTATWDKYYGVPCVAIKVAVNAKDAQILMENLLKSEGLRGGKSSTKKIAYERAVLFSPISSSHINIYISFDDISKDKNTPATMVNMFVRKGTDAPFETSQTDAALIANVKKFLNQKYNPIIVEFVLVLKLEAKRKEIEQTKQEIENLQKLMDTRARTIAFYEKEIEKAKANIDKANIDIENALILIENQKQVLARQEEELTQIK